MKRDRREKGQTGRTAFLRAASFGAVFLLLLPVFLTAFAAAIPSSAAEDAVDGARFFFSSVASARGTVSVEEEGRLLAFHFYGSAATFDCAVPAQSTDAGANALRFLVAASSRTFTLSVAVSYNAEGEYEGGSFSVSLEKSDRERSYTLPVEHAAQVRRIRFSLSVTGLTSFSLRSLSAVSAYADGTEFVGALTSCALSADGKNVLLRGTIPSSTVVQYRDAALCLYRIDALSDRPADGAEPIAVSPISARFEFKIAAADLDLLGEKLLVTLREAERAERAVAAPCFADLAEAQSTRTLAFKGAVAVEGLGGGTVLLDVDLSGLFDPRGSGYAYRYDGTFYYFARTTVDSLRDAVARCRAAGDAVLFRLLCGNPEAAVPYTFSYNESGVRYYALNATTAEGRRAIAAAVTYLCSSLLGGQSYDVAGFVLGRNIEDSGEYDFMSAGLALDVYAEQYLMALRTVFYAASHTGMDGNVYVGMGDEWYNDTVGPKYLYPNYDASLLLETLAGRAAAEGGICFSVLIGGEGSAAPYDGSCDVFGLSAALPLLADLASAGRVNADPILLWTPERGGMTCSDLSYLYYTAVFSGRVSAFIADFREMSTYIDAAELRVLWEQIDTVRTLNATALYLGAYGLSAGAMPGFDGDALVARDYRTASLYTVLPAGGSAVLCDFSGSATDQLVPCGDTQIAYFNTAVRLTFDADALDPSVLLGREPVSYLTKADGIAFLVDADFEGERTVTVTINEPACRTVYSATLSAGEGQILFAPGGVGSITSVKLTLAGGGTLAVRQILAYSSTLDSETLAAGIADARGDERETVNADRIWTVVMLALIPISTLSALLMRRPHAEAGDKNRDAR